MNELSPLNVRSDSPGDVRRAARNVHESLCEDQRVGERFVAVRPAAAPLPNVRAGGACNGSGTGRPPLRSVETISVPAPAHRNQLPAGDRAALLIGTALYDHPAFAELPAAGAGLRHMKHVLERPDVGMMDSCQVVGDATRAKMLRGIETFLEEREYSETVVVYVTGYACIAHRDGQLFLIAKDTDPDDLEGTAVSADFLRRQLQECGAASKVVLLDYCDGGPREEGEGRFGARRCRQAMPEPAGVYVIAASDRPQPPAVMVPPDTDLGPSRFTAEIVEGLRTGRVKAGLGPWVTADDLSTYLVEQMHWLGVPEEHHPAMSTLAVSGNHVIARSAVRALSLLDGDRAVERPLPAAPRRPRNETRYGDAGGPGWRELLAYYRACLAEARAPEALPSRDDESADYVPIGSGAEVLLSGKATTAPAPSGVDTFDWKEREVWYGYPLVILAGGGRRHSASPIAAPRVAPLLTQRVDVTVDARGAAALRPAGPVMPHAGVLQACLDDREAASVLASWQQSWRPGDEEQMLAAVRQLMKRLGLAELESLDPVALAADDLAMATRTGVHNAACVLYVESNRSAALALSAELGSVAEAISRIPGTALEQLAAPTASSSEDAHPLLVTPDDLNESQEAVVTSAMSRPLTVATAPPGTGKPDLIVDLVATAVAAGQKVLVASPDDAALQDVTDRCTELAPGLLIKTGDAQARAEEKQLLRQLLRSSAEEPHRRRDVVVGELSAARDRVSAWREQLAERVGLEARLRKTSSARTAASERLGLAVHVLDSAWRDDDQGMAEWIERARALTTARFFGTWRRRRAALAYLRAVTAGGLEPGPLRRLVAEPQAFDSLLLFARAEQRLRRDRRDVERICDDELDAQGQALADAVRALSAELVGSVVGEQAMKARPRLEARRMALEPGGRARPSSQRELMTDLGGWAVTIADAQQLSLEPGTFDLVVIDDAHRCSVASVLPLLFRAKRALVIGDPTQGRPPVTVTDQRLRRAREQAGLSATWLEERRLTYQADSAYDLAVSATGEAVLLDEHEGSHPGIARIVDEYFYQDRLTVLTDVKALRRARDPETGQSTLLLWEDVHGTPERGPNGGSWRNQAEIDRVVWAVNELRDQLPDDATVGVVAPFRAQIEELRSLFRFEPVRVGAVDDFGPGGCDAIVLSLVAGQDTPAQTVRSVETRADLWNVALTRARSHVVVVGHHAFWSRRSGLPALLARLSSVRSFHVRPIPPAPLERVPSADPLAELFHDRLAEAGYTEIERDAVLDGYRCDFVVGSPQGATAVLLDHGSPASRNAARRLRLLLRRRHLLTGLEAETDLAISRVTRVLRVPAWQVRSGEAIAGLIDDDVRTSAQATATSVQ